jgi:glycosyltransferase involved in cell wall biosynthesis
MLGIAFEIIVMEDGSQAFLEENQSVESQHFVRRIVLTANIGRSAIRNRLAEEAKYDFLLFLDCDAEVDNVDFLKNYLSHCHKNTVTVGGTKYSVDNQPNKYSLRLKYGTEREATGKNFTTFNFLIPKEIFQTIRFDETIRTYGYEDLIFGYELKTNNIPILYIDNPLIHKGLDENKVFLQKAETGIKNLYDLYQSGRYPFLSKESKILSFFATVRKYRLQTFILLLFRILTPIFAKNLTGKNPSLFLFDFYKLGYLCKNAKNNNNKPLSFLEHP